jgi:hypothetical protein
MARDEGERASDLPEVNPEDPNVRSKHHRKLESHGGSGASGNISYVPWVRHAAWHALYQNMDAAGIMAQFQEDYEVYGTDVVKSDLLRRLHEGWANNTDEKIKRTKAWYALFEDMTLEEIVREINTIWLDPAYEIRIGMARVKTVELRGVAPRGQ